MAKPAIILVHGSWHRATHMDELKKDLERHGFKCNAVDLPSTQSPDLPPANLSDDCAVIRDAVESEFEAGNNVMVVAHSYGGVPTNNGLKGFDAETRATAGHRTSVVAVAYISACPLPAGISFWQSFGEKPRPVHDFRTPDFMWVGKPGPEHYFYNMMEPEMAKRCAATLLPQSFAAYIEVTTYAAYKDIPSFYLRLSRDQALAPVAQEKYIERAREDGADIGVEEIEADHTPFVGANLPKVTDFIIRIAENGKL